jgi:hypothetical protein
MPRDRRDLIIDDAEETSAAPTPWRLWTAAHGGKSETPVAQSSMAEVIDDNMKERVSKQIKCRNRDCF